MKIIKNTTLKESNVGTNRVSIKSTLKNKEVWISSIASIALFLIVFLQGTTLQKSFASPQTDFVPSDDDTKTLLQTKNGEPLPASFVDIDDLKVGFVKTLGIGIDRTMDAVPEAPPETEPETPSTPDEPWNPGPSEPVYHPEYAYPNSTLFEVLFKSYKASELSERLNCSQSIAVTDNNIVVLATQWGINADYPSVGLSMIRVHDRYSKNRVKTFYVPDTYDPGSNSYIINPSGRHMHCNGVASKGQNLYVADGGIIAKINIDSETIEPIRLPNGISAIGLASTENGFVVKSGTKLVFLDESLSTILNTVETGVSNNQDIAYNNGYVYLCVWTSSSNTNSIVKIDGNTGNVVDQWDFPYDLGYQQYELEGMDFLDGHPIILFNTYKGGYDYITWMNAS